MSDLILQSAHVSEEGLDGSDLRSVRDNNRIMDEVLAQKDPLCTLLVQMRWVHYQLSRKKYGEQIGIDDKAVENTETKFSRPEHETYSAIFRKWQADSVSVQIRTQMLDLITQKNRIGDSEIPLEMLDRKTLTVTELYRQWSYMFGMEEFEKRIVLTYGCLWQREATDVVPDFEEVRSITQKLEQNHQTAQSVWIFDKLRQLESRGVEEPIREYMVRLEAHTMNFSLTPGYLRDLLGCTDRVADRLCHYEIAPFEIIQDSAKKLIDPTKWDHFCEEWQALEAADAQQDTFGKAFVRIRDDQKITNRQLALEINIVAPEKREGHTGKKKSSRKEGFRPSASIRQTLDTHDYSSQAPAGLLIGLVCREGQCIGDTSELEADYLQRLYLDMLEARARRTGSVPGRSFIRRTRQLWGVSSDSLEEDGWSNEDILAIENHLTPDEDKTIELLTIIEEKGRLKVEAALERRRTFARLRNEVETTHPLTVMEVVSIIRKRLKGLVGIRRALQNDKTTPHEIKAVSQLKRVENGELVPSLPSIKAILRNAGNDEERTAVESFAEEQSEFWEAVLRDWYLQYPEELTRRPKKPWTSPLARFFGVVMGEHAAGLKQFWEQRITDISYPVLTRNIQVLNNGDDIAWGNLSRYLDAADLAPGPRRRFGEILHEKKKLKTAYQAWREEVLANDDDPSLYEHQLGLTAKERKMCGISDD